METLTCSCLNCHAVVGNFENLWDKIGKTYYSPVCDNSKDLGCLAVIGDVRAAPKAGAIANSFLQDVACQVCGEKLGLKCDSAPEGHVLIKDQLILRVAGMTIVSDSTGRRASLRVRRKFSLIPEQPVSADTKKLRERSASLISSHREAENGVYTPGATICLPSSDNDPLPGLLHFAEWAKDAIAGQRKDVDRVCSTVSRMEEDMNSFRDYVSDLCKELAMAQGDKRWENMKTDFDSLRNDVGQLQVDMGALPGSIGLSNEDGVGLSSEELEALTGSLMKINQKVNEVENLKLDLQLMKGRLKRFEDVAREFRPFIEPRAVESTQARSASRQSMMPPPRRISPDNLDEDIGHAQNNGQIPRKRKSDEFGDNTGLLKRSLSVPVSKKRGVSTDPTSSMRRPSAARKPSGLSKVQLIDDTPSPVNASKFMDGDNSEGDVQISWRQEREYNSAPDTRPSRRRTLPSRGNLNREANSPNDISTPPPENRRSDATTPPHKTSRFAAKPNTSAITPRSRRRAYSEGLRNADGIRLTKNGTPDRRSGNYKYLKQYYDKLKAEKDQEDRENQGDTTDGSGNEMNNEVLQSVEKDGIREDKGGGVGEAVSMDREEAKRAELEARDRLVRETLEREFEG